MRKILAVLATTLVIVAPGAAAERLALASIHVYALFGCAGLAEVDDAVRAKTLREAGIALGRQIFEAVDDGTIQLSDLVGVAPIEFLTSHENGADFALGEIAGSAINSALQDAESRRRGVVQVASTGGELVEVACSNLP